MIAAALRGEEVVIDRAGTPTVRLTPVRADEPLIARRAEREKWFGAFSGEVSSPTLDSFLEPTFSDEEVAAFACLPGEAD